MGTLANISGKQAVKAFVSAGWMVRGQVGSHVALTKAGARQPVCSAAQGLAAGTLRSLIRSSAHPE